MTDEADEADEVPTSSAELGRSYASLLGEPAAETTPPPPLRIIEALLFAGSEPLTAKRACGIVRGLTADQFDEMITELNAAYRRQGRAYSIQPHGHGWVLTLRPRHRHIITRLYGGEREARLSTAAIDVLALVAYRQPISKPDVDSMRGGDSGALLRHLVRRGLVQIIQSDGPGKEGTYETTTRFLEMFELQSLDDLPKTHDLQQL